MQKLILIFFMFISCGFNSNEKKKNLIKNKKYIFYENFPSKFVEARDVEVFLPSGYDAQQSSPVLYMFDGQNIFHELSMLRKKWDSKHFLSKNPTFFSFEEKWKNSFFPKFFENFRKTPKSFWGILFGLSPSMGSLPNPFHHFSGILLIIWLFFQIVEVEAEAAILNLTIWRRSRFLENLLKPMSGKQR